MLRRYGQGKIMTDILIRAIDDVTVRALKRKADELKQPVEDVARDILRRGVKLSPEDRRALADRVRAMTPHALQTDSTDLIRRDRDTR
jgi:plasmid stability protein